VTLVPGVKTTVAEPDSDRVFLNGGDENERVGTARPDEPRGLPVDQHTGRIVACDTDCARATDGLV
jgi:hypothetical protein